MKRLITNLALVTASSFTLLVGLTSPSQASSWHKGTPKALRGDYSYNTLRDAYDHIGWISFKKNTYSVSDPYPLGHNLDIKQVHYKKIGQYYRLKGKTSPMKLILKETYTADQVFYKQGKRLKNVSYKIFKAKRFTHYKGYIGYFSP
ncbi:hypothetical protein [Levilactobacillus suantsaii]|uniref:Uncharacterized protein n=1 Tax=Levilactobacillus suantsaii TaxID=2292255 RepID=A0A4Q0VLV0_9LACO|nr:hypothetical protein [Levilactobacillus suantsaii]QMU07497.1 hypothetical protein H3M12_08460 [Levilactobacillus suantsaii]RXI79676.1 hypothetical protein DXH47_02825 [Levilactobacillus suantsaii]